MLRFYMALAIIVIAATTFFVLLLPAHAETGIASYYGMESGRYTANGEHFRPDRVSCAHRIHPFGTRLKVTVLSTGRSIVCRVNDRGPARWTHRIIDVSRAAAVQLGMIGSGTARVSVERLR
jgi:rare lipoprotein A